MSVDVAAFFVEVQGKKSRLDEYLSYALASKEALAQTTPKSRYVVMTDEATAPKLAKHIEIDVLVPSDRPLMLAGMEAQVAFLKKSRADLVVLPDVDCIANRDLTDAIPQTVGLGVTHKGPKFHYRIINCAYVRDRELGIWFLERAIAILETWPADRQDWWGDQEAWQSALGIQMPGFGFGYWAVVEREENEVLVARPDTKTIHMYPASTHNCPMAEDGVMRKLQQRAFMVHFKGDRKDHLHAFMAERFCA